MCRIAGAIRVQLENFSDKIDELFDSKPVVETQKFIVSLPDRIKAVAVNAWGFIDSFNQKIDRTLHDWQGRVTAWIRQGLGELTAVFVMPSLIDHSEEKIQSINEAVAEKIVKANAAGKVKVENVLFESGEFKLSGVTISPTGEQAADKRTILYFPSHHEVWQNSFDYLLALQEANGCHIVACNYRGVGDPQRFPRNEHDLLNDAAEIVRKLIKDGTPKEKIVLFGHSVGGTLALNLAAKLEDENITLNVVGDRPPKNIAVLAPTLLPIFSSVFECLCRHMDWNLDVEPALRKMKGKIVTIQSTVDPIVPIPNGVKSVMDTFPANRKIEIMMNEEEFKIEYPQYKDDLNMNPHIRPYTKREFTELIQAIITLWPPVAPAS